MNQYLVIVDEGDGVWKIDSQYAERDQAFERVDALSPDDVNSDTTRVLDAEDAL